MKYQRRPEFVDAVRWWNHGDHPAVGKYTHPFHKRILGTLKDELVYPGNWVITYQSGHIETLGNLEFEMRYMPVEV